MQHRCNRRKTPTEDLRIRGSTEYSLQKQGRLAVTILWELGFERGRWLRLSSIYREFSVNTRKFIHTCNKTLSSATMFGSRPLNRVLGAGYLVASMAGSSETT